VYEGRYLKFRVAIKQIELKYQAFVETVKKEIEFLAEMSGWGSFLNLHGIFVECRDESIFILIVTDLCQCSLAELLSAQPKEIGRATNHLQALQI
jgi:hypothetical protein